MCSAHGARAHSDEFDSAHGRFFAHETKPMESAYNIAGGGLVELVACMRACCGWTDGAVRDRLERAGRIR